MSRWKKTGRSALGFTNKYGTFLVVVAALFWLPMVLFQGHPLSVQFAKAPILLVVIALQPLKKLGFWTSIPVAIITICVLVFGHSYLAFEILALTDAEFNPWWSLPMWVYFLGTGFAMHYLFFDRYPKRSPDQSV